MLNPMAWGLGSCGPLSPVIALDPFTMLAISAAATAVGTGISAMGTLAAGKSQQQAAKYEADQLNVRAKNEQGIGQQEAEKYARTTKLVQSRSQALNAAGGFTDTDSTSLRLHQDVAEYGALQEDTARYGGAARRSAMEAQAKGRIFEGDAARQASKYKAAATIMDGVSTIATRFSPRVTDSFGGGGDLRFGRPRSYG